MRSDIRRDLDPARKALKKAYDHAFSKRRVRRERIQLVRYHGCFYYFISFMMCLCCSNHVYVTQVQFHLLQNEDGSVRPKRKYIRRRPVHVEIEIGSDQSGKVRSCTLFLPLITL